MHKFAVTTEPAPARCLACPAFHKILLVHHDAKLEPDLKKALQGLGQPFQTTLGTRADLPHVAELDHEFVLWDCNEPGAEDLAALRQLRRQCPQLPVVMLAAGTEAETAIEIIKAGAHDYLPKPIEPSQFHAAIEKALQARRLACDALLIPGVLETKRLPQRLIGRSPAMQEVYKQIGLVAERHEPVLIQGETGTGKELVAQAIHRHSSRRAQVFLAINCAALPESLLESELFGHEKGAFTGAAQRRRGAFEQAHGGTLFLDEIGDMSLPLQAKILRVLQQGEIHRVGGHETVAIDVRLLAATNKNLEEAVANGSFREDLYYRLKVVSIYIRPLREHAEDIQELVEYFIDRYSPAGEPRQALDAKALRKLQLHAWPGNVRELENSIRRALVVAKGRAIMEKDITVGVEAQARCTTCPPAPTEVDAGALATDDCEGRLDAALELWLAEQSRRPAEKCDYALPERIEVKLLRAALQHTHGNQLQAARLLGISRTTLRQWMKKHQVV